MPYANSRVSDYLEHSELMFTNAKDKTILPLLERHNVGAERCDLGLSLCGDAYTWEKEQVKLHGEQFRSEFIGICRIALKDHPQLLEKLGIVVYTKGYVSAKSQAAAEEKKKQEALKAQEAQEAQETHAPRDVQAEQEVQVNQETKKKHKSKK
ncbi:MAG: hypothetical protein NT166_00675 [Candidatus Aminicenantes bacterium]|nr:hypothetical protein [Candidatus Aminicenantes bacterium]